MTQRIEKKDPESTRKAHPGSKRRTENAMSKCGGKRDINLEYRKSGDGWISRNVKKGRSGEVGYNNKPVMQA